MHKNLFKSIVLGTIVASFSFNTTKIIAGGTLSTEATSGRYSV